MLGRGVETALLDSRPITASAVGSGPTPPKTAPGPDGGSAANETSSGDGGDAVPARDGASSAAGAESSLQLDVEGHSGAEAKQLSAVAAREGWGVIPAVVDDLFNHLKAHAAPGTTTTSPGGTHRTAKKVSVFCSYMQIYQDKLFDLLTDSRMKHPLPVREANANANANGNATAESAQAASQGAGQGQVFVPGLSQYRVESLTDVLELLRRGAANRAVRATEYNLQSSRSHALVQINIEIELSAAPEDLGGDAGEEETEKQASGAQGEEEERTVLRRAKLNMVDLAGSEKFGEGARENDSMAKELMTINSSLSALGNCISALGEKGRRHIPYRDSTLTRLLQDSLGGNTRTIVLATVSPYSQHLDETSSTLQFATRAKRVTARLKVNQVVNDAILLKRAQREILTLRRKLTTMLSESAASPEPRPPPSALPDLKEVAAAAAAAARERSQREKNLETLVSTLQGRVGELENLLEQQNVRLRAKASLERADSIVKTIAPEPEAQEPLDPEAQSEADHLPPRPTADAAANDGMEATAHVGNRSQHEATDNFKGKRGRRGKRC